MSTINNYDGYGYGYEDLDQHDTGSRLEANPPLQLPKPYETRKITQAVRQVYEVEKKCGDWKGKLVNALIILAAAVALIVLGVHTGFALGIGIGLMAYGLYQMGKTVEKGLAQKKIEKVAEDATDYRVSKAVHENQIRFRNQGRGNVGMQRFPQQGNPSAPFMPRTSAYIPPPKVEEGYSPAFVSV